MSFAVIQTGGKQYKVAEGQKLKIEKVPGNSGDAVAFDRVLLVANGDDVEVGTPIVAGAQVEGKILRGGRYDKKIVFKYHSKTRYRKKKGHRQEFTEVEITGIRD